MKAVVQDRYGGPETLEVREIDPPRPKRPTDVLLRVRAVSLNAADWHSMRGQPPILRVGMGLTRPRPRVRGIDVAGVVESVGPGVTRFRSGDAVFGTARTGSLAELTVARESDLAAKPARASFDEAAALPIAGLTALQALRDQARIKPGQHVLVYGAGGGVGTFTVQIAKALGARVTAITRGQNSELLRSIGADHVIDYETEDPLAGDERYDALLDIAGSRTIDECRRVLTASGALVTVGAATKESWAMLGRIFATPFARKRGQRIVFFVSKSDPDDLATLARLVDDGKLKAVIERSYALDQSVEAMRRVGTGGVRGKLVVRVA